MAKLLVDLQGMGLAWARFAPSLAIVPVALFYMLMATGARPLEIVRLRVPDRPGVLAGVAGSFAEQGCSIEQVVQQVCRQGELLGDAGQGFEHLGPLAAVGQITIAQRGVRPTKPSSSNPPSTRWPAMSPRTASY